MSVSYLDIPLVIDLICQDLAARDIYRCTLVSRVWLETFCPYLWQNVRIRRKHIFKRLVDRQMIAKLQQNSYMIHSLTTHYAPVFHRIQMHRLEVLQQEPQTHTIFNNLTTLRALSHKDKISNYDLNNTFIDPMLDIIESTCPRLQVLELGFFRFTHNFVLKLARVIWSLSPLKDVTIMARRQYIRTYLLRHLLRYCARLERLALSCKPISSVLPWVDQESDPRNEWKLIQHEIEESPATVANGSKPAPPTSIIGMTLETMPPTSLKELQFTDTTLHCSETTLLFPLLRKCPNLERIDLPNVLIGSEESLIAIFKDNLPEMRHLDLRNSQLRDGGLARLLEVCAFSSAMATVDVKRDQSPESRQAEREQGLQSIAGSYFFRPQTISSLIRHHHAALQEINVADCAQITGMMIQSLLCLCPNLRSFQAFDALSPRRFGFRPPFLRVRDLEQVIDSTIVIGQVNESDNKNDQPRLISPWKCRRLKVLELQFEETELEVFPRALYLQISRLQHLEELYLKRKELELPGALDAEAARPVTTLKGTVGPLNLTLAATETGDVATEATTDPVAVMVEPSLAFEGSVGLEHERPKDQQMDLKAVRDQNMAEGLQAIKDSLTHLYALKLDNLHQHVYTRQLKEMRRILPKLGRVSLGKDNKPCRN
ncbi:hypothetical protein BGX28_008482 [Mortierella sp. GBA30]|nr:hypothetical protein BGX28_008482 [Mortierella sp. GBA30]